MSEHAYETLLKEFAQMTRDGIIYIYSGIELEQFKTLVMKYGNHIPEVKNFLSSIREIDVSNYTKNLPVEMYIEGSLTEEENIVNKTSEINQTLNEIVKELLDPRPDGAVIEINGIFNLYDSD